MLATLRPHSRPLIRISSLSSKRNFTVLGLESSADDTCAAVVTSDKKILSNVVIRQFDQNKIYGGIHPLAAINAHQRNMPIAVRRALSAANLSMSQIDGIAFTRGPGIGGCLSVCSNAAKTLAAALNKPLVGVHHMQAHALTALLAPSDPTSNSEITFPFLTLLVSGGHTLLLLATSPTKFRILATTADEAIGRVIDKVSRALGLEWGERGLGAALEDFCSSSSELGEGTPGLLSNGFLTNTMPGRLAFSFSGLHSQVDRVLLQYPEKSPPHDIRRSIAREFQTAAFAQLEEKLVLALKWCSNNRNAVDGKASHIGSSATGIGHVVVSGGVASNLRLRQQLQSCIEKHFPDENISLAFPPPNLCTDNAAMIAWASMDRFLASDTDDYSIEHRAKWSIEDLDK